MLHSRSGAPGGTFTVRTEVSEDAYIYIAVEDDGGPWKTRACQIRTGHGLDLVQAVAGPANWGITGDAAGRLVWARLPWPGTDRLERELNTPGVTTPAHPEDDDTGQAELETLAAELTGRGLRAKLITPQGRLPHLEICGLGKPMPPQRVYAQADWYFWPTAERIAASDDVTTAARTIARVLRTDGGTRGA